MSETQSNPTIPYTEVPLAAGQTYKDKRSSQLEGTEVNVEIVFEDHQTVILEYPDGHRRFEPRDLFDKGLGKNWELVSDTTEDESESEQSNQYTDPTPFISALSTLKLSFEESLKDPTGAKANTIEQAIDTISQGHVEQIDFVELDGIGEGTQSNLHERGIRTNLDIRAASDDLLLNIGGIGEKNLQEIRKRVLE